jgi:hypothetical protein
MNIISYIDNYKEDYVYFSDPIYNTIINVPNSKFIRILYSTKEIILNGIYIYIPLNDVVLEKYYNKYKCVFSMGLQNKEIIDKIKMIEYNLLKKYKHICTNKTPQYKISEQLRTGYIKIFNNISSKYNCNNFLLKISGIWETNNEYGITFKFSAI